MTEQERMEGGLRTLQASADEVWQYIAMNINATQCTAMQRKALQFRAMHSMQRNANAT